MLPQVIVSVSYKTTKLRRMFTEKAKQPLENMTTPDYGQDIKDNIKERTGVDFARTTRAAAIGKSLLGRSTLHQCLNKKKEKK